jgi:putative lipase involved disintegration of autophagic bodies
LLLKVITQYVQYLHSQPEKYSGVAITGHSLGGGIAIISGAQTGTMAVALSGPNAILSRNTFEPPVTIEQLSQNTFVSCSFLHVPFFSLFKIEICPMP